MAQAREVAPELERLAFKTGAPSMRKLFLHIMVSLDGYIEGPNGELDWHFSDDEFEEYINGVLRSIGGMFFGRKSFELLAGYWPDAEKNPTEAANPADPRRHVE